MVRVIRYIGCLLILCLTQARAQPKYILESGEINFASQAQLEIIKASSTEIKGILEPSSNQFVFSVNIGSFKGFNSSLQRVHFNENYMESEKWPVASFTGKIIEDIDYSKDGTYDVRAKGDLDIHGQKQSRIIKCKVNIRDNSITVDSNFIVPLTDHNISIPRIVSQKIATEIQVNIKATMAVRQ